LCLIGVVALACNGDDGGGGTTPSPAATATVSATPVPTAVSGAGEIAYISLEEGDIWFVNADGSGQRKLTEGQCRQAAGPFWSRRGDKIACVGSGTEEEPATRVFVFDLEGRTVAHAEHKAWVAGFAWSPDDRHFVYGTAEGETWETARRSLVIGDSESEVTVRLEDADDARWSPDGAQLAYLKTLGEEPAIYDLASGQSTSLPQGLRPLAWALGGKALLVAANYQQQEFGATYEVYLMNVASVAVTPVPELDNGVQFWLASDGQAAAFLAGPADRVEGGVTISILDLTTGGVTPIQGAVIGYPSERIPTDHIAFSPDGAYLYWVDVVTKADQELTGTIYRARPDGSELTQLGALNANLFIFSPDRTRVLYFDGSALSVGGVEGGAGRLVVEEGADLGWPLATWRPLP